MSIKLIEVDVVNVDLIDGKYLEEYIGNVVKDAIGSHHYFHRCGTLFYVISEEMAEIMLGSNSEPVTDTQPTMSPKTSLVDSIGIKPKTINIEF